MLDLGKDDGSAVSDFLRIAIHATKVSSNIRGKVSLVDDEKVSVGYLRVRE